MINRIVQLPNDDIFQLVKFWFSANERPHMLNWVANEIHCGNNWKCNYPMHPIISFSFILVGNILISLYILYVRCKFSAYECMIDLKYYLKWDLIGKYGQITHEDPCILCYFKRFLAFHLFEKIKKTRFFFF